MTPYQGLPFLALFPIAERVGRRTPSVTGLPSQTAHFELFFKRSVERDQGAAISNELEG